MNIKNSLIESREKPNQLLNRCFAQNLSKNNSKNVLYLTDRIPKR